ncbi:hypothetical protein [Helicobacter sp.]|uniref:hypothetical protein n=1 Tax=Helicobacter sp. TaxID=218 RepID=UPI00388F6D07
MSQASTNQTTLTQTPAQTPSTQSHVPQTRQNQPQSYRRFSSFETFLIRWKTRSLGTQIDALILILSVLVYMGRDELEQQLEHAKTIIYSRVRLGTMAQIIYERVEVELAQYMQNEELYIKVRNKMFEVIISDIQLYGIALDLLQGEQNAHKLQIVRSVVQKAYDEQFILDKEARRLLEAQEKTNARI